MKSMNRALLIRRRGRSGFSTFGVQILVLFTIIFLIKRIALSRIPHPHLQQTYLQHTLDQAVQIHYEEDNIGAAVPEKATNDITQHSALQPSMAAADSRTSSSSALEDATALVAEFNASQTVTDALGHKRKAIVGASLKGDNVTWLKEHFPDWSHFVYTMDHSDGEFTVSKNKGHEGAAYLTYIIDYYDNLPEYMVFLHAKRYQWHSDDPMYDNVPPLQNLRLERVDELGFVNLRCAWYPGCSRGLDFTKTDAGFAHRLRTRFKQLFTEFFPDKVLPEHLPAHCCGQFAVSKAGILKRPKAEWAKLRDFLWDDRFNDQVSGTAFEYLWHLLFGREPGADCISARECYCKTYGLCDLDCPSHEFCKGRWRRPPFLKPLPRNWPLEGQGEGGWIKEGWWLNEVSKGREEEQVPLVHHEAEEQSRPSM